MSNHAEQKQVLKAPEFKVSQWIDANGNKTEPLEL